jgi:hypothetical protein
MIKIGRIVCDNFLKIDKKEYLEYITYGEYTKSNIPTLFIGFYDLKKNIYPDLSILDKTIETNKIYWCFSYKERKQEYFECIKSFYDNVFDYYFSNIEYINIDPIFHNIKTSEDLFNILPKEINLLYYNGINNNYYLLDNNFKIYSLSTNSFKYFNIPIKDSLKMGINIRNKLVDMNGITHKNYELFYGDERIEKYIVFVLYFYSIYRK